MSSKLNDMLQLGRAELEQIAELCRQFGVTRLSLFGSQARDDATPSSDVDVLLEIDAVAPPTLFDLVEFQDALSVKFGGRKVDFAFPSILNNPYRRARIEPDLRQLYPLAA